MKKVSLWIAFWAIGSLLLAQAPQGITFQTIIYDNNNVPVSNQTVDLRFSIMSANNPNTVVYQEEHDDVDTDDFGQIALVIGKGIALQNTFANADWGAGDMYDLKIEVDLTATGANYADMGTNKFFTVPYAFYAEKAGSVEGMWEKNGNDIYYDQGNVGVGTPNPTTQLHIGSGGGAAFNQPFSSSGRDVISLYSNRLGMASMLGFGFETGTVLNQNGQLANERILTNRAEGGFRWYLRSLADGGASAAMLMNRDGELGIDIDDPKALLHIAQGRSISNSRDGTFTIGYTDHRYLTMDTDELQARQKKLNGGVEGASLHLNRLDGDVVVAEKGNGRLGIGTTFPKTALHVAVGTNANLSDDSGYLILGKTNGRNMVLDNNELQGRNNSAEANILLQKNGGNVGIGSANSNARLNISDESWQLRLGNPTNGAADWYVGSSASNWLSGGDRLVFGSSFNSNSGTLFLHANSRGASIATKDLPNGYRLAVDGKIICEELHVEMSQSWPDYVFAEDYQLPSLAEVEASIEQENHLPGIPSAQEIESQGLDLAAMQRMQMEKIEELTLYIIQLKKEIEALKAK